MSTTAAITKIDIPGLKKVASGKVREIFELDDKTLLFVATDRISAYDVILENGIPSKGPLLTALSNHWFNYLQSSLPDLKTHLITTQLPASIPEDLRPVLEGRSMVVRRVPVIPLESIVRGYITGSAWSEYKEKGTVHGMAMPQGLRESEKFARPIWTPSTKAEQGAHDENISREKAAEMVGEDLARSIEDLSLKIYELAHAYALPRNLIIADTKLEFGLDAVTNELILIDEVLTPDSSRFWPREEYEVGRGQRSYDKQYLRDWLTKEGLRGKQGTRMPEEVARETGRVYKEGWEMLVK